MSGSRAGLLVPPFVPVDRRASPLVLVIAIAALLQTTFLVSIDPSLAGFMLERFGALPKVGEVLAIDGLRLEVTEVVERRIASVLISRTVAQPASPGDTAN